MSQSKYEKFKRKQEKKELKEHDKWVRKEEKHARKMQHERELHEMDQKFAKHQADLGLDAEPAMLDWPSSSQPRTLPR